MELLPLLCISKNQDIVYFYKERTHIGVVCLPFVRYLLGSTKLARFGSKKELLKFMTKGVRERAKSRSDGSVGLKFIQTQKKIMIRRTLMHVTS